MFRAALFRGLLCFAVLFGITSVVLADVVIPGRKKVRRDCVIDLGAYADKAVRTHEVQPGDTISGLAEQQLGSTARQKEILALNPGLTPEGLKAGASILMPPRSADASEWWHFFAVSWGGQLERAFHEQKLLHHHYWTELWAVPHAKAGELLERLAAKAPKRRAELEALPKESWVSRAGDRLCGYASLADGSPIAHIVETHKVQAIESGKIVLEKTQVKNLNKNREPVSGAGLFLTSGNILLLLLASGAGIGLFLISRRRRTETSPEPAVAS